MTLVAPFVTVGIGDTGLELTDFEGRRIRPSSREPVPGPGRDWEVVGNCGAGDWLLALRPDGPLGAPVPVLCVPHGGREGKLGLSLLDRRDNRILWLTRVLPSAASRQIRQSVIPV